MAKLSQYEIDRQANIERNRALLQQLELKQAVQDLGIPAAKPAPAPKAKPVQSAKKEKKEKAHTEPPRRQSARLRHVPEPNESPSNKRKREAEIEEKRAKDNEALLQAEEENRLAKRPRHYDLQLSTLADQEDESGVEALSSHLQAIHEVARRVGDPEAFTFEEERGEAQCVAELREKLSNLKVVSRAKVTEDRVYSAAYHPDVTKDLIFFGDKHGQLGIWDARAPVEEVIDEDGDITAENSEGGKYWRLQAHWPATSKSSISAVKLDPTNSHNVFTSSYDCTLRIMSFTTGVSREIYSSDDILLNNFDLTPSGHEMWISDSAGGLTHLDLREDKSKARWFSLSDQKIGCVSVNPTRPHFLVTASNSRTLKIWDVRKLNALATGTLNSGPMTPPSSPGGASGVNARPASSLEFDGDTINEFIASPRGKACLRGEWRHDKSVTAAYWDPRGRSIVSTSYDDTLRLWDIESSKFKSDAPFPSSRPFSRIKHNCQTGKWLTLLRAQWSPNPDAYPHFTIANMDHSLDIFSGKGDLITRLSDKTKITAVQAVTCSHPNILERAVSGNASGRCVLWAPADME